MVLSESKGPRGRGRGRRGGGGGSSRGKGFRKGGGRGARSTEPNPGNEDEDEVALPRFDLRELGDEDSDEGYDMEELAAAAEGLALGGHHESSQLNPNGSLFTTDFQSAITALTMIPFHVRMKLTDEEAGVSSIPLIDMLPSTDSENELETQVTPSNPIAGGSHSTAKMGLEGSSSSPPTEFVIEDKGEVVPTSGNRESAEDGDDDDDDDFDAWLDNVGRKT